MMNKYLYWSFRFIWRLGCGSGVIPLDFDAAGNKMKPTKWLHKKVISKIALVIFFFRMVVLGIKLVIALRSWESNIAQVCMLGFYESIFLHATLVQISLWRKGSSICWIFNQITDMTDTTQLSSKIKPAEAVKLTWVPGHIDICYTLTMAFYKAPSMSHHLFSDLPSQLQEEKVVFWFFFVIEALSFIFFYPTTLFEFSTQTYFIKAFIELTDDIQKEAEGATTQYRFGQTMKKYRRTQIVLEVFIHVYERTIERIKTVFTIHTVMCNYFLIRWHHQLAPEIFGFVLNVGSFTGTLPPLLYNSGFKIHENSVGMKYTSTLSIAKVTNEQHRLSFKKKLKSLKPLAIRVAGGLYFLDRSMTPLFYKIVFDTTVSMLVSTK